MSVGATAAADQALTTQLREYAGQVSETGLLRGRDNKVYSVAFSPDGRLLATGTVNKVAYLWERTGSRLVHQLEGHGMFVWSVCFSPDGRLLATSSGDMSIFFWEVAGGRPVRRLWAGGSLYTACFSPDSRWLAAGSHNRRIYLWELASRRSPRVLAGHGDDVYSVAFSPDGRLLASGSDDHTVRLWDVEAFRPQAVFRGDFGRVYSVAFSPDGRLLALACADHTVRLWDVAGRCPVARLAGHQGPVWNVAFSPDGRLLASGSGDRSICLWEVASGQRLRRLEGHRGDVNSVAFSPDGRLLVSGSDDRTVRFWDTAVMEVRREAVADIVFPSDSGAAAALEEVVSRHRETLVLCHVPLAEPRRVAAWMLPVARLGLAAPLWLVHDLGALLAAPGDRELEIRRPEGWPPAMAADCWERLLHQLAATPLWREVRQWSLRDELIGVIVARLLVDLEVASAFRLPASAAARGYVLRRLVAEMAAGKPEGEFRRPPAGSWSPAWAVAIARRASRLEINELRLLRQYGPASPVGAGSQLLELYGCLELPPAVRRTLAAMLRLLPRLRVNRQVTAGEQTYAVGGYQGVARRGSLDSLVPVEMAYPRELFLYRLLNREALYYGREAAPERRRELVYILTQAGLELLGDGELMARALTLALAHTMRQRGFVVRQSFIGARWTPPMAVETPGELQQLLYYRDRGWLAGEEMLAAVRRQLAAWRGEFTRLRLFWIVSEYWGEQLGRAGERRLPALAAQAPHYAWLLRGSRREKPGFAARLRPFFAGIEFFDRKVLEDVAESG